MLREASHSRWRRFIIAAAAAALILVAASSWIHLRRDAGADGPLVANDPYDDTVGQGQVAAGDTVTYGYLVLTNTGSADVKLVSAELHFNTSGAALTVEQAQTLGPTRAAYQWAVYNSWPPPDLGADLVPLVGAVVKPTTGDDDLDTEVLFPIRVNVAGDYRSDGADVTYEVDGVRYTVHSHTVFIICEDDCKVP